MSFVLKDETILGIPKIFLKGYKLQNCSFVIYILMRNSIRDQLNQNDTMFLELILPEFWQNSNDNNYYRLRFFKTLLFFWVNCSSPKNNHGSICY